MNRPSLKIPHISPLFLSLALLGGNAFLATDIQPAHAIISLDRLNDHAGHYVFKMRDMAKKGGSVSESLLRKHSQDFLNEMHVEEADYPPSPDSFRRNEDYHAVMLARTILRRLGGTGQYRDMTDKERVKFKTRHAGYGTDAYEGPGNPVASNVPPLESQYAFFNAQTNECDALRTTEPYCRPDRTVTVKKVRILQTAMMAYELEDLIDHFYQAPLDLDNVTAAYEEHEKACVARLSTAEQNAFRLLTKQKDTYGGEPLVKAYPPEAEHLMRKCEAMKGPQQR